VRRRCISRPLIKLRSGGAFISRGHWHGSRRRTPEGHASENLGVRGSAPSSTRAQRVSGQLQFPSLPTLKRAREGKWETLRSARRDRPRQARVVTRRIGVDEISFRKRHRYLTVVADHDTGDVVWVAEGKTSNVLKGFFESLSAEVCNAIEIVTMDMSQAYQKAVRETLPNATIAFDHFHVAKLANEALNEVRRELVRQARKSDPELAKEIKGMRWPTLYSFESVPAKHFDSLAALRPEAPLGRAYLLKEQLLEVLRHQRRRIAENLEAWTSWASRSRLAPFVRLGRTIREHARGICAFVQKRVTNARAEGINNKIRLLSHRAYGFHSAAPLIATVYLCCGGIRLPQQLHLL